jgi:hypothetical protein
VGKRGLELQGDVPGCCEHGDELRIA